jgi:hypothetical protein
MTSRAINANGEQRRRSMLFYKMPGLFRPTRWPTSTGRGAVVAAAEEREREAVRTLVAAETIAGPFAAGP